ncbi:hypothetical protein CVT24_005670 [Panaeolus cyanescens]|uniref:CCHC-type domain-containing protein n=1 Tax=Panaeolus cyanescens TaxID=181874 RepID=A0A409WVK0_9AGAR|nr:hypothetical protein CVT24_005670 [Panaeolus cyanescens]
MGLSVEESLYSESSTKTEAPTRLPMLDEAGTNWITWKDIVYGELLSRGLFDNVEGLAIEALRPVVKDGKTYSATDTEFKNPLDENVAGKLVRDWKNWVRNEWSAKTLIFRTIPRTIMIEIRDKPSVAEMWKALCKTYESRTATGRQYLLATLFRTVFDAHKEDASLHAHFAHMMTLRQRYIESQRKLKAEDIFKEALIASLPVDVFGPTMDTLRLSYETTGQELTVETIIEKAYEHWERLHGPDALRKEIGTAGSGSTALASSKSTDGAKKGKRPKCSNCRRMGHLAEKCFARGGGAEDVAPEWWKQTHDENGKLKVSGGSGEKKKKPHAKAAAKRDSSDSYDSDDSDSDRMGMVSLLNHSPSPASPHHVATVSELNNQIAYRGSLLDGGANHHFTPLRHSLRDFRTVNPTDVDSAAGVSFPIIGYGRMTIKLPPPKGSSVPCNVELRKVYYAPTCPWTLVSQAKLIKRGFRIALEPDGAAVINPSTHKVISFIPIHNDLYWIDRAKDQSGHRSAMVANISLLEFHRRMGHLNFDYCRKMVKHGMVEGVTVEDVGEKVGLCRECVEAKIARKPFPKASQSVFRVYGEKVVADVWGPAAVRNIDAITTHSLTTNPNNAVEAVDPPEPHPQPNVIEDNAQAVQPPPANDDIHPEPEPELRQLRPRNVPEGHYKEPDLRKKLVAQIVSAVAALGDDYIQNAIKSSKESFVDICHFALAATAGDEPSIQQALAGPDRPKWVEASKAELAQILKVHTWDIVLVEEEDQGRIIPCRWVLRIKRDALGNISRYKARLVAKGFKQQFGVDFNETFAPTIRPATLRFLLTFAATSNSVVEQADVKNAYLHGVLPPDEIIYMEIPPYFEEFHEIPAEVRPFVTKKKPYRVACRLWRPLYGSKQGANKWYEKLVQVVRSIGFTISQADEALFYRTWPEERRYMLIGAATDDFTLMADSNITMKQVKESLNKEFELVELGPINWLLGVSVERNIESRTFALGQEAYIDQILARFNLSDAKTHSTPMEPGLDLTTDAPHVSSKSLSQEERRVYREGIGSLMYLSVMTRPDIAYAVSTLSQFLESPKTTHLNALWRVFKYLKGTKKLRLVIGGDSNEMDAFSDADWAQASHRHSISGYAFRVAGGVISWASKKQSLIALSSTESEYMALTFASRDISWINKLVVELTGIFKFPEFPITLWCDNQGAIQLSNNPVFHMRTKHIDVQFHYTRQVIRRGIVKLEYIQTDDQVADIFTKALGRVKLEKFRGMLGLRDID